MPRLGFLGRRRPPSHSIEAKRSLDAMPLFTRLRVYEELPPGYVEPRLLLDAPVERTFGDNALIYVLHEAPLTETGTLSRVGYLMLPDGTVGVATPIDWKEEPPVSIPGATASLRITLKLIP